MTYNPEKINNFIKAGLEKSREARIRGIAQYNVQGKIVATYKSIREAEKYGFSHQAIGRVCRGKQITHLGFTWKYIQSQ